jgi:peptidoglycan/xylan/chitin deacetylase (PgdA/CDA1 family)
MTKRIPILTFHDISENSDVISLSSNIFRRCMERLSMKGYRSLGLIEAIGLLKSGLPFPDKHLVITFDDGYLSVYQNAFPELARNQMSTTVFLTTGVKAKAHPKSRLPELEGKPMLNWMEIREMCRSGFHFGSHTLTHPDLTRISTAQCRSEILDSKGLIEDSIGFELSTFAYPYGRFNQKVREIVRRHFACACSDKLGLVTGKSDLFGLERVDAYYLKSDRLFDLITTRIFPLYIKGIGIPRKMRRILMEMVGDV